MATEPRQCIQLPELGTKKDFDREMTAVLELQTGKHTTGRIVSSANVYWRYNGGIVFGIGEDYRKTVYFTPGRVTATQKALDHQHAEVFPPERVEDIKREVLAHYRNEA